MATNRNAERAIRRVEVTRGGPMLIEGPIEIVLDDGSTVCSDRFVVAICMCKRSKTYPLCDTSHRRRKRSPDEGH